MSHLVCGSYRIYRTRKETKQLNGYFFKKLGLLVGLGQEGQEWKRLQRVWPGHQRMLRTLFRPFEVHLREELRPERFFRNLSNVYGVLPLRHISHSY